MMEARLGVITCDKCGEPMKEAQPILIIAEGNVTESGDELDFHGSCVQYACHLDCWDGVGERESVLAIFQMQQD
jgi:hypothetical protein